MIFETLIKYGRDHGKYCEFRQGDACRYPHLKLELSYNAAADCFLSTNPVHNALEFLTADLLIRELMVPSARRLFIRDLLQLPYQEREKLLALHDVADFIAPAFSIETVVPSGFGWEGQIPLHLIKVESPHIFPIGIVLKGTDLAIIDQHTATRGQEIGHAIYHFKEGISTGAENITEVHGDPFFLYALQCSEGRLARRVRMGNSPRRIKFPDYVCLRALIGSKILPGVYHGALGLLAPPMQLVSHLVPSDVLVDALFDGSSTIIENAVDSYLGAGAYNEIFMSFDVFGRLGKIRARKREAVEWMFEGTLFQSELDTAAIRHFWEHPESREEIAATLR